MPAARPAAVVAATPIGIVPLADRLGRAVPAAGAGDRLAFTAALTSAGAAAVRLFVAKMDFDEYPLYPLFGLFFAGSAIA